MGKHSGNKQQKVESTLKTNSNSSDAKIAFPIPSWLIPSTKKYDQEKATIL